MFPRTLLRNVILGVAISVAIVALQKIFVPAHSGIFIDMPALHKPIVISQNMPLFLLFAAVLPILYYVARLRNQIALSKVLLVVAILVPTFYFCDFVANELMLYDFLSGGKFEKCSYALVPLEIVSCKYNRLNMFLPYALLLLVLIFGITKIVLMLEPQRKIQREAKLAFSIALALLILLFTSVMTLLVPYVYVSVRSAQLSNICLHETMKSLSTSTAQLEIIHGKYSNCFNTLAAELTKPKMFTLVVVSALFIPIALLCMFLGFDFYRKEDSKSEFLSIANILASLALWYFGFIAFASIPLLQMQAGMFKTILSTLMPAFALLTYGFFARIFGMKILC